MVAEFDESKFYLGSVCNKEHNWNASGYSLRYKTNRKCFDCNKLDTKRENERAKEIKRQKRFASRPCCPYPKPDFDTTRFYLGKLCPKQHDFCNGLSLLKIQNQGCYQCTLEFYKSEKYREYNREFRKKDKYRAYSLSRYYANHERNKEKHRIASKKRRDANPGKDKAYQKQRYYANHEKAKSNLRKYAHIRRIRELSAHHANWSHENLRQCFERFGDRCAYCDTAGNLTIDHFIPISKGGSDCIGNFVPACKTCNTSKHCRDPIEWLRSKPFGTEKRIKFILKALGKTESNYCQIPLL